MKVWTTLIDYKHAPRMVWRNYVRVYTEIGAEDKVWPDTASISRKRSAILTSFGDSDADVLVWMDADQIVDSLKPLVESAEKTRGIVGTMIAKRGMGQGVPIDLGDGEADRINAHQKMHGKMPKFLEARSAGAGVMALHRDAVVKIGADLPVLSHGIKPYCAEIIEPGKWFGEDISLCMRARDCGVRITVDTRVSTEHVGDYHFTVRDAVKRES